MHLAPPGWNVGFRRSAMNRIASRGAGMRTLFTHVNEVNQIEPDDSRLVIGFDPVDGWDSDPVSLDRERVDRFLGRLQVNREEELVGLPVRVTVDDEGHGERIVFLPSQLAEVPPPPASAEPEVGSISVVMPNRVALFTGEPPEARAQVAQDLAETSGDPCSSRLVPQSSEERQREEDARAAIEQGSDVATYGRYFLYRESYGDGGRWDAFELEPSEFERLKTIGAYIHDDGCKARGIEDSEADSAETTESMERLLDRITSRRSAELTRDDVERLAAQGHLVSCAVY
jgi:hypothetical protein